MLVLALVRHIIGGGLVSEEAVVYLSLSVPATSPTWARIGRSTSELQLLKLQRHDHPSVTYSHLHFTLSASDTFKPSASFYSILHCYASAFINQHCHSHSLSNVLDALTYRIIERVTRSHRVTAIAAILSRLLDPEQTRALSLDRLRHVLQFNDSRSFTICRRIPAFTAKDHPVTQQPAEPKPSRSQSEHHHHYPCISPPTPLAIAIDSRGLGGA